MYHSGRDNEVYNISFFFFVCLFFCGISIDQFNLELLIIVIFSTLARDGFFMFFVCLWASFAFLRLFSSFWSYRKWLALSTAKMLSSYISSYLASLVSGIVPFANLFPSSVVVATLSLSFSF